MDKENYKNSYEVYRDSTIEETYQDRSIGESERGEDGKILQYKFKILIRNKEPLEGTLSREEMELIYRLYSSEGANLTQRTVSRYFPLYTVQEFKKIIKAFDITKASAPFPPHFVDEKSPEELITLNMQAKENDFLKKFEQEKSALFQKKFADVLKDHVDLKQKVADFKEFIGDIKIDLSIDPVIPEFSNEKILVVYLSDMHIGADVSEYALYKNKFNKEEAQKRMQKVYEFVTHTAHNYNIGKVCIVNLGDSLDGFDGQTTRGGHGLPQNLNNKDQYKTYFSLMMDFFKNLSECGLFETIDYYCVGTDNHAGDAGYIANKALEAGLQYLNSNINCVIFDKIMDHVYVGNHTLILHHGKDSKNMFRNLPLYLNDKTENYINQYIDYHNLKGNISFVKGDLHQSTTGFGYKFRYKNTGSFFGSSEWIQDNFGGNGAVVDVDIFDGDNIMETRINLWMMWQDILKYGIKNMELKEIIERLLFYTGEYEEACKIVEYVTDEEVAYLLLKDGFMIKLSKDGFNCWSSLKSFSYHNIIIALGDTHLFDIMYHEEFVPGGDHSDDIIEFRELNLERYPDVAGYIKLK